MGFLLDDYLELRPYLYHTSPTVNARQILGSRRLEPTGELLRRAGRADLIRTRRAADVVLSIEQESIIIRDQLPLNPVNIAFDEGWHLPDLVECLNLRVFFWPGTSAGPIRLGTNHFSRYASERPIVVRMQMRSLLNTNPGLLPQFSRYNTGAPRQNQGNPIPRGPNTFTAPGRFKGTRDKVREVGFVGGVFLPADAEQAWSPRGPWRRAFDQ